MHPGVGGLHIMQDSQLHCNTKGHLNHARTDFFFFCDVLKNDNIVTLISLPTFQDMPDDNLNKNT